MVTGIVRWARRQLAGNDNSIETSTDPATMVALADLERDSDAMNLLGMALAELNLPATGRG